MQKHVTMEIRAYHPDDEAEVVQLWIDCGLVVPHNNPLRDIQRKLQVNPEWFLIGEIEGEVVASCMVGYEGHRGWINYLAVTPSEQRKGLATEMMARAEEMLRAAGCPKINLQVRSSNQAVIEFYKSIGFRIDDVVSMGKRLEPDKPYQTDYSNLKRPLHPMPEFVRQALDERGLMQAYKERPAYQQNDYIGWIARAKRHETKEKRLHQMLDELEVGGVYMNMKHPASRRE